MSTRVRLVRVRNVLTGQEHILEVPSEETLGEIRRRYLMVNAHAHSYVWKALPSACASGSTAEAALDVGSRGAGGAPCWAD